MDYEKLIEWLKKPCWGESAHLADRERRCVVMPCQPGYKISYKSSIGFWCNAVIKDYTPKNIFITAETEIPNAEPLSHTFSILEIEIALQRDKE